MDHWHACEECGATCGPCVCDEPGRGVFCHPCLDEREWDPVDGLDLGGEG